MVTPDPPAFIRAATPARTQILNKIKETIAKLCPEIDQTKVLTDEEQAELKRQLDERRECEKLASQETRAELRERILRAAKRAEDLHVE